LSPLIGFLLVWLGVVFSKLQHNRVRSVTGLADDYVILLNHDLRLITIAERVAPHHVQENLLALLNPVRQVGEAGSETDEQNGLERSRAATRFGRPQDMDPVAQPSEMPIRVTGAFRKVDRNYAIRGGLEPGSVLIGIPRSSQIDFDRDRRARIGYPGLELFDEERVYGFAMETKLSVRIFRAPGYCSG